MDNENKTLDFHQFEWYLPTPPEPLLLITISSENVICLNRKLCEYVPKQIQIGINMDGTRLGLAGISDKGYRVPKNGMIKDDRLVQRIKQRGVRLPARYLVEEKEGIWLGTLIPSTPAPPTIGKTPKKPRKQGLKAMLPKQEVM